MIEQLQQPAIILRRLRYSKLLCEGALNECSKRLADLMVKRWFSELDRTDICGCACLDEIESAQEDVTSNP